jgi:methylmalonyl-CoA mutase C-terminal domain/subunit
MAPVSNESTPAASAAAMAGTAPRRILLAKTALDGHWRGISVVARALRDGGFQVILGGMSTGMEIVRAAIDEDVDLVGLNVGGHVEVAERIIGQLRAARADLPIFAGGIIAPWAAKRLQALGVEVFPPGSQLDQIVECARRLTADASAA